MEETGRDGRGARRAAVSYLVILGLGSWVAGCTSSSRGTFASNDPGATGTVVSGKSDTAGLSAGVAFMAPATATKSP